MESIMARALESALKYWLKSFSRDQFKIQGRTVQLSNIAPYGVPNYGPNGAGKKFLNSKEDMSNSVTLGDFVYGTSDRIVAIIGSQRAINVAEAMIMYKVASASSPPPVVTRKTEFGRTEFDVGLGLSSDCPDRVRHQRLLPNTSDSGPSPTSEANFSVCDYIGRTESEAKGRTESVVRVRRTLSNAQTTDRVRGPSPSLWSETLANSP
ncbi:hypothetical protein LXL04_001200 [Taraxacum kok-saghyz]